jgi:hypothetical protein
VAGYFVGRACVDEDAAKMSAQGWHRPFNKAHLTVHYFLPTGDTLCGQWDWVGGARRKFEAWRPRKNFCRECLAVSLKRKL